jgi:streptogramin lyase
MQLDLNLEAGKRSFIVSFNPESSSAYLGEIISNQYNSIGEVADSSSAAYQAVEFKILLSALGDAGSLTLLDVRPMNGVCCDENWYAIDNISPVPVAQLDEVEHASDKQQVCGGEPTQPRINFQLTEAGVDAELIWRTGFIPWWVRSSPDGRVLAVSDGGDAIYELKPDGSLAIAFQCPGVQIETFTAASDGALWFTSCDSGRLYRVDTSGEVRILAQHGNHNLEAGPNGEVYAMGEGLVRIAPDGSQEPITDQVKGRKFAVSPNGEIAAMKDDSVVLIADSGELKKLASGYGPEQWLAFDSDGLLYVTHWSGVDVINLTSGSITPIPWLVGSSPGESGTFAPDGRLLLYHPNVDVYAVDLVKETIDVYHQVTSNSRAMAIDPEGDIYIAYGDGQPNGETTIYRVVDNQTLELVLTVPYGLEHAMAFDQQGFGYLALADQTTGGAIIRFDLAAETFEVYYQSQCHLSALAVHPLTGQVWWEDCGRFYALGEDGDLVHIDGVPDARDTGLAITPDGALFTIGFFEAPDQNTPMKRYLYRYDQSAAQWEQIADLSQSDPAIMLATLTACPNGIIYTIESLDADHLPINRSSFNAVRRLEADGSLTLLGYDFSFDGEAAYCDPATGRVLFTSGAGIFSLTPP